MAKFISVTTHYGRKKMSINIDHIISYMHNEKDGYGKPSGAIIQLTKGDLLEIDESAKYIDEQILT